MAGDDHWFVPKPAGYGAMPANAKGWTAVAVVVATIIALAVICFVILSPAVTNVVIFIVGTLAVTAVLVIVAKAKTKGEWRWRSGQSTDD